LFLAILFSLSEAAKRLTTSLIAIGCPVWAVFV